MESVLHFSHLDMAAIRYLPDAQATQELSCVALAVAVLSSSPSAQVSAEVALHGSHDVAGLARQRPLVHGTQVRSRKALALAIGSSSFPFSHSASESVRCATHLLMLPVRNLPTAHATQELSTEVSIGFFNSCPAGHRVLFVRRNAQFCMCDERKRPAGQPVHTESMPFVPFTVTYLPAGHTCAVHGKT